jgi:hypothetical protein
LQRAWRRQVTEQKNAPDLPIGRFLKSTSLGGNRVILAVRPSNTMLVTIERKRLDPHRLYGVIVNESERLICLHREIDFQLDGYVFIRKKDITSRTFDTPSLKYSEALMRKEGLWLKPDRFVRQLDIESWETTVTALIGKPVMVENENKSAHTWVGIVDACTRTIATVHCFDGLGVFDDDPDRIPLRSVTSIQYGDRYTQTHYKHLKTRMNNRLHRSRGSPVS